MLRGIASSPGIGIGQAVRIYSGEITAEKKGFSSLNDEVRRLYATIEVFSRGVLKKNEQIKKNLSGEEAEILLTQIAIINDPELTGEIIETMKKSRVCLEYALRHVFNQFIGLFLKMEEEILRAKAADFMDIRDQMLQLLMDIPGKDFSGLPAGSVIVADDIPPSLAASLDPDRIRGVVTQSGTMYSHASILTRALRLPSVVCVDNLLDRVRDGDMLIVDGDNGDVIQNPDTISFSRITSGVTAAGYRQRETNEVLTRDGSRVRLCMYIAPDSYARSVFEYEAGGYDIANGARMSVKNAANLSENEQFVTYRNIIQAYNGLPVVFKVAGADQERFMQYTSRSADSDIGRQYTKGYHTFVRAQIGALLRASAFGWIRIVVPVLSAVEDLAQLKSVLDGEKTKLRYFDIPFDPDVPFGVLLDGFRDEDSIEEISGNADFITIDIDRMVQYVVQAEGTAEQPGQNDVWKMLARQLARMIRAAHSANMTVSVCGEWAADARMVPFLIGAGVDELDLAISSLPLVRGQISALSQRDWERTLDRFLSDTEDREYEEVFDEAKDMDTRRAASV